MVAIIAMLSLGRPPRGSIPLERSYADPTPSGENAGFFDAS